MKKALLLVFSLMLLLTAGCVRRIVTIDSQPQGADIYLDRKLIGETPYTHEFLYYGGHHLELVKEGYENFYTVLKLKGPLYEYFPLSLLTEVFIPWEITDEHNFNCQLKEGKSKKPLVTPVKQPQPALAAPRLERIENR